MVTVPTEVFQTRVYLGIKREGYPLTIGLTLRERGTEWVSYHLLHNLVVVSLEGRDVAEREDKQDGVLP